MALLFCLFPSVTINSHINLLLQISRCYKQPASLTLSFSKFRLTNFHKTGIFQSKIHRARIKDFDRRVVIH